MFSKKAATVFLFLPKERNFSAFHANCEKQPRKIILILVLLLLLFQIGYIARMSKAGALDLASGVGGKIDKTEVLSAVEKYHYFLFKLTVSFSFLNCF